MIPQVKVVRGIDINFYSLSCGRFDPLVLTAVSATGVTLTVSMWPV